jgi:hypothetical protein
VKSYVFKQVVAVFNTMPRGPKPLAEYTPSERKAYLSSYSRLSSRDLNKLPANGSVWITYVEDKKLRYGGVLILRRPEYVQLMNFTSPNKVKPKFWAPRREGVVFYAKKTTLQELQTRAGREERDARKRAQIGFTMQPRKVEGAGPSKTEVKAEIKKQVKKEVKKLLK